MLAEGMTYFDFFNPAKLSRKRLECLSSRLEKLSENIKTSPILESCADVSWHLTGLGVSLTSWIVSPRCDWQEYPLRSGFGVILDVLFCGIGVMVL